MMCSKLLKPHDPRQVVSAARQSRMARPHVRGLWPHATTDASHAELFAATVALLVLLAIPPCCSSCSTPRELALAPGRTRGILRLRQDAEPPISTSRNRRRRNCGNVVETIPEPRIFSSSTAFRACTPGFAGILLKPWRSAAHAKADPQTDLMSPSWRRWPAVRSFAFSPPPPCPARPAARRCNSSSARPATIVPSRVVGEMQKAATASAVHLHRHRPEVRHAADRSSRSTPRRRTGSAWSMQESAARSATLLGGNYVNRFAVRPLLSGHPAGAARPPRRPALADALSGAHDSGELGRIVHRRQPRAQTVQPNALTEFQQFKRGDDLRRAYPGRTRSARR